MGRGGKRHGAGRKAKPPPTLTEEQLQERAEVIAKDRIKTLKAKHRSDLAAFREFAVCFHVL